MLKLSKRGCKLGEDASSKAKEADGQKVRTITFELTEVLLDKRELNALLSEPHAWEVLFNDASGGCEPYLKGLKNLVLKDNAEGAFVELTYGLDSKVLTFTDCKLSKIELELRDGGDTAMSCKVTVTPALDESLAELFEQFGNDIDAEVRADLKADQQELPINRFGEGEQSEKPKRRSRKRVNGETHA